MKSKKKATAETEQKGWKINLLIKEISALLPKITEKLLNCCLRYLPRERDK